MPDRVLIDREAAAKECRNLITEITKEPDESGGMLQVEVSAIKTVMREIRALAPDPEVSALLAFAEAAEASIEADIRQYASKEATEAALDARSAMHDAYRALLAAREQAEREGGRA